VKNISNTVDLRNNPLSDRDQCTFYVNVPYKKCTESDVFQCERTYDLLLSLVPNCAWGRFQTRFSSYYHVSFNSDTHQISIWNIFHICLEILFFLIHVSFYFETVINLDLGYISSPIGRYHGEGRSYDLISGIFSDWNRDREYVNYGDVGILKGTFSYLSTLSIQIYTHISIWNTSQNLLKILLRRYSEMFEM
jgi:hypothetical protein